MEERFPAKPLRLTFDDAAELYDAVRPGYPPELMEAIRAALQGSAGRILEIGGGTGQATLPFAQWGCQVTVLEPGPNLAAIAARNLAAFPLVDVEMMTFEEWAGAECQYDLVLSATAFHWVSPEVRYTKSAHALAEGGWLALFWNNEGSDESSVGRQLQAVYNKYMPSTQAHPYATHHPAGRGTGSVWEDEINRSRLFGSVTVKRFPWTQWYTTGRYLQLLETYSDHRTLPPKNKHKLFEAITEVLTQNGGGRNKPYLTTLYLAQVSRPTSTS